MAFHDVRLSEQVERGAQSSTNFNTTVTELSSGQERRTINWSRPKLSFDISYGIDTKENQEDVLAFFYAREGRGHSFRFRDWADFQIGRVEPQEIATGDGSRTRFQIIRRYEDGAASFSRNITRPASDGLTVYLDDVETNAYTADTSTGVLTFSAPPDAGSSIKVVCEFDVPVRFDSDALSLRYTNSYSFSVESINLIEVRETLEVLT